MTNRQGGPFQAKKSRKVLSESQNRERGQLAGHVPVGKAGAYEASRSRSKRKDPADLDQPRQCHRSRHEVTNGARWSKTTNRQTLQVPWQSPLSFGINPPVGATTERGAAGHPLSNNKTSPIHHDMNCEPNTTIAGSPYNGCAFTCVTEAYERGATRS
jgi:hypothetical protein